MLCYSSQFKGLPLFIYDSLRKSKRIKGRVLNLDVHRSPKVLKVFRDKVLHFDGNEFYTMEEGNLMAHVAKKILYKDIIIDDTLLEIRKIGLDNQFLLSYETCYLVVTPNVIFHPDVQDDIEFANCVGSSIILTTKDEVYVYDNENLICVKQIDFKVIGLVDDYILYGFNKKHFIHYSILDDIIQKYIEIFDARYNCISDGVNYYIFNGMYNIGQYQRFFQSGIRCIKKKGQIVIVELNDNRTYLINLYTNNIKPFSVPYGLVDV